MAQVEEILSDGRQCMLVYKMATDDPLTQGATLKSMLAYVE